MSTLGPLLWFAAIVALIPLSLWLLKRSPYGAALGASPQTASPMRIVGGLSLGPGQRVVAVEVGEGESRTCLVLGVTAQQITALHALPPGPAGAPQPAPPAFAALLSSMAARSRASKAP